MLHINKETCIGCTKCTKVCPGNLLIMKDSKASIRNVSDCWGCTACIKTCPVSAIGLYLGADIGGNGGILYVHDTGTALDWKLESSDGISQHVIIEKHKSNDY